MGCNSSKAGHGGGCHGGEGACREGWRLPLVRSLSRTWSMPVAMPPYGSDHGGSFHAAFPDKRRSTRKASEDHTQVPEEKDEEMEDHGEEEHLGQVINPNKSRVRESGGGDAWELVPQSRGNNSSGQPRKRARMYSKSMSLPRQSLTATSDFHGQVHGLPLVLEERSPNARLLCKSSSSARKGLFYGSSLAIERDPSLGSRVWNGNSSSPAPASAEDCASSPSSSSAIEDDGWCVVGPRFMDRAGGGEINRSSQCLRDKTNVAAVVDRLEFSSRGASRVKQQRQRSEELLDRFEARCPPGGENRVVLYVTSLQGIRRTYEQCRSVRTILEAMFARIDERDVSIHAQFRDELRDLVAAPVPRLFIKGRYIGGAEEAMLLNESGVLRDLLEGIPRDHGIKRSCEGCGGVRFIPCLECSGSCKLVGDDDRIVRCWDCNENGLVRCPLCFY